MELLVVGARPNSLGAAIAEEACRLGHRQEGIDVATVGISGHEDFHAGVEEITAKGFLDNFGPRTHVVCTAGVNYPDDYSLDFFEEQLLTNCLGVVNLFHAWHDAVPRAGRYRHFVAISSNSAHIARSNSSGYCASKAALSMALRCLARRYANDLGLSVYAYELGWLQGTPMSSLVGARLAHGQRPHRIPGGRALLPHEVATMVVANLQLNHAGLNGSCLRLDGGEQ